MGMPVEVFPYFPQAYLASCLVFFCLLIGIYDMPKFKKIYPRTTVLYRTHKATRPPIEINTIPEIFYVFSDIRIKMSFIRLFKSFWRIKEKAVFIQNLSLTWVIKNIALASAAFLFWLYRKPPDKCYFYESFVIQVKNQR